MPRPYRVLPEAPGPGLGAYCPHLPPLGGHRGSPTDACKVSLARRAAHTQAPKRRSGQRCRGPRGHLAAAIPTLPALAPEGHTHSPHAAGRAGRAGRRGDSVVSCTPRPGSGRAGLARLRGRQWLWWPGLRFKPGAMFSSCFSPQPRVLPRSRQEPVPSAARLQEPSGRKFQLRAGRVRELSVRGSDGRGAGAVMRHLQSTLVFSSHAKGTLLPVPTLEVPCFGSSLGWGWGAKS